VGKGGQVPVPRTTTSYSGATSSIFAKIGEGSAVLQDFIENNRDIG
jgi:hypothetical protein